MSNQDAQARVKRIIEERLIQVAPEIKRILPPILSGDIEYFTLTNDNYFALFFVDPAEKERIRKLTERKIHPFPFLIKPEGATGGSAFKLEKSRFVWIEGCTVENLFSLSLGKDSTVVLSNHRQIVNTKELGHYEYSVKLGYIISFGEVFSVDNFYSALEDLITHSLKSWADVHRR